MMDSAEQGTSKLSKSYSKAVCIGAGFSGIGVAITLKRWYSITDVQLFDRSSGPAGTWTNNSYPGCACDIPAALYSFSYEQNPNWSRLLAKQPEIKAYLDGVVQKHNLKDKIRCNTAVESCIWSDKSSTWTLQVRDVHTGEQWLHESPILFNCIGGLDEPRRLDCPGAETFEGPLFHSARYDHSVDLRGKRVAVVGNGCTGVQLVPALINDIGVKSVAHFVRSKHWIFPNFDIVYPKFFSWGLKHIPGFLRLHRFHIYYGAQKAWAGFYMDEKGKEVREQRQGMAESYMRRTAPAKYHDMLVPDFEVGCKRRIWDTGYLKVLHQDNVKLTNVPIQEIVPKGIKTHDGIEEVDAIILANGFDLQRKGAPIKIVGRNGVELYDRWQKQGGSGAYSCIGIADFPNMMLIAGPNTATGHTSVVIAAENTTNLALRVLKPVLDGKAKSVEPNRQAEEQWHVDMQEASRERVWSQGGCRSWYVNDDNKWVATLYPWSQVDLWRRCLFPKWSDWEYKTAKGSRYRYWGLDRFLKPATLYLLAIVAGIWFWRVGIRLPLQRLWSRL